MEFIRIIWKICKLFLTIFIAIHWASEPAYAFVLNDDCPAPPPCRCSGPRVNCNYLNLMDMPKFTSAVSSSLTQANDVYIYMTSNKLTTIPGHVFENIHLKKNAKLHLWLDVNHISSVHSDAFVGIENVAYSIDLGSNNLTTLPTALGSINSLHTLYINRNPLKHLDSSTMSTIGRSLNELWISMGNFETWPHELSQLNMLDQLTMDYIPFVRFPDNSFDGIGSRLTSLTFNHAKFTSMPSLCGLRSLHSFTVRDSVHLNQTVPLFHTCHQQLTNLSFVTITRCQLHSFPNILTTFPSTRFIDLQSNNISAIDNRLVPDQNEVRTLELQNNWLTRIPDTVSIMKQMWSLDLHYNNITEIGDHDLAGLKDLSTLNMNHNPLQSVSKNAFNGLTSLDNLDMSHTNLTTIPEAVLSLPALYIFPYSGVDVHCDCSLSYLKHWNVSAIPFFTGFCENDALGITILKYLKGPLKNCP